MEKVHILLVEKGDNEIDFFSDALEESGLSFLCSIARSFEHPLNIFNNTFPDAIFINVNIVNNEHSPFIKKIKSGQSTPVIFYSTSTGIKPGFQKINYVQMPRSTSTMAHILKNLFTNNTVHDNLIMEKDGARSASQIPGNPF